VIAFGLRGHAKPLPNSLKVREEKMTNSAGVKNAEALAKSGVVGVGSVFFGSNLTAF